VLPISLPSRTGRDPEVARARLASISRPAWRPTGSPLNAGTGAAGVPAFSGSADPGLDDLVAELCQEPAEPVGQQDADSVVPGSPRAPGTPRAPGPLDGRRWLPAVLREAQLVAPRQAVVGLVAVALLSALLTAGALWLERPRADVVGPPPLAEQPTADQRPTAGPASAKPTTSARPLVLAVVGRVRHPGLVSLPPGSRVIDAVQAAGGPLPGTDLTMLNLARKVVDGEQIVVGGTAQAGLGGAPAAGSAASGGPATPLNLNSASLEELDALPGVGPVIAQRILDWRTAHGGFTSVEQLLSVPGIGDRTMERLRTLVTV
jgi:competence protein ComEA